MFRQDISASGIVVNRLRISNWHTKRLAMEAFPPVTVITFSTDNVVFLWNGIFRFKFKCYDGFAVYVFLLESFYLGRKEKLIKVHQNPLLILV